LPLAAALLLSLALGRTASRFGVPGVTVYLLVGLALGPHALQRLLSADGPAGVLLLGPETAGPLNAVGELAVGFILFGIGGEFRFQSFRRIGARLLGVSAVEVGLTGLLVGGAVLWGTGDWRLALIAPALAVASAPSATLVTLRELEAEGPASRSLIICVGQSNLAALLLFPLLLSLAFGGGKAGMAGMLAIGAIGVGALVGIAIANALEVITGRREIVLLGLVTVLLLLGMAHRAEAGATGLAMLACFSAGLAVSNASPHAGALFRYVENTVYPLYVLFFVGAGCDLHVGALAEAGALGALFIGARAAGKVAGTYLGLRLFRLEEGLPPTLGVGLLCQAGVALGLVSTLEWVEPDATAGLRSVVVASVVVFELIGPWLVRRVAVEAGEVKLANLVPQAEATGSDAWRWVMNELRRNLGLLPKEAGAPGGPTVEHAMRRRPRILQEAVPFERVLKALGESDADVLPVVGAGGELKGVISYDEVKNALYDPVLRGLVIAEDLAHTIDDPLAVTASLEAALERMDRHRAHSWPVVAEGRLVGMVRRSDVYALIRRSRVPRSGPR
jgi:Kef-type K+ transport system membrane component KefB/CBS domain-containing protein